MNGAAERELLRKSPQDVINLQSGTQTISANDLNQVRRQTLLDMARQNGGGGGTDMKPEYVMKELNNMKSDMRTDRLAQQISTMKVLSGLDSVTSGRGVPKTQMSPAQMSGYFPQNPNFFGMQKPEATPYQSVVTNKQNLMGVIKNYQVKGGLSGAGPFLDQVRRKANIISEQNRPDITDSIYQSVHGNSGVNLYRIQQKNTRENSMYAFK